MNDAHLHLVVNHFPIITPVIAILIMIAGYIVKSVPIIRTAYAVLILSAIFTLAAAITGERAEEMLEHMHRG